jgi:hypothetical protein
VCPAAVAFLVRHSKTARVVLYIIRMILSTKILSFFNIVSSAKPPLFLKILTLNVVVFSPHNTQYIALFFWWKIALYI